MTTRSSPGSPGPEVDGRSTKVVGGRRGALHFFRNLGARLPRNYGKQSTSHSASQSSLGKQLPRLRSGTCTTRPLWRLANYRSTRSVPSGDPVCHVGFNVG